MLNVGIIGTGFGQKIHLPAIQEHPDTQAIALWSHELDKVQTLAQQHAIPHASDRLAELLALPDLDAVMISTPPFLHYEMAKAALAAGKHVFLEKPVTLNVTEAQELYHLAQQSGLVAIADFEFRFVPAWQQLAHLLKAGAVGSTRLIKIDWLVPGRADPERAWNWYARQDQGGGILGAVGSHVFDYIHWLFGDVQSLCAQLSCAIADRPDPKDGGKRKPVDAPDVAQLLLQLADGTPVQISLSSATYEGRGHWLEVYGELGTLVLGSDNLKDYVHGFKLWHAPAGQSLSEVMIPAHLDFPKVYPDGRLAPVLRVVDHWVNCIQRGTTAAPSLREGVLSQLLMDLTVQSQRDRQWVQVPSYDQIVR
ncbi:MAG: Gfo/Idh/MocA family oxidoreductase [Spirulina sp. SIO3F2]|nr:Gfo/Idh/MocA family oxidoreductase [Spirulina sp. SIO3F2]